MQRMIVLQTDQPAEAPMGAEIGGVIAPTLAGVDLAERRQLVFGKIHQAPAAGRTCGQGPVAVGKIDDGDGTAETCRFVRRVVDLRSQQRTGDTHPRAAQRRRVAIGFEAAAQRDRIAVTVSEAAAQSDLAPLA